MTSIARTAYSRFGRVMTARELEALSPSREEIVWARESSRGGVHLLGLLVALKCFQRLAYFPRGDRVPELVVERVRDCLGLSGAGVPDIASRTAEWQRALVRERAGAVGDLARALAEQAIRAEAEVKNHPPDLINVALEVLVREGLELPGFRRLTGSPLGFGWR